MMLSTENTLLVLIDVQEKLMAAMHEKQRLQENLAKLLKGMNALHIPILWLEQSPSKMGPTIAPLLPLLDGTRPISKSSFSATGEPAFSSALHDSGRRQILIAGIETHVCVYQTAVTLIRESYAVDVVADAVGSRHPSDHKIGLQKISDCGRLSVGSGQGHLTTVETALFELLQSSEHPAFRDILSIIR